MKQTSNSVIRYSLLIIAGMLLLLFTDVHAIEIKKQTLPNGLTVIHVERNNLPVVMATLLIKASPLNESDDKAGIAYLTSRMLAEGTFKRSGAEISEEIEFLGASINAGANSDFTTVSLSVLKKDIEKGFDLFSDVLLNPSFDKDELKRKKDLIKGDLKQREEDPAFVADRIFIKEVFGSHPYGRPVEGNAESIDRISRKDIVDFYQAHYRPDNAILSVVGDLSVQELDVLIKKYLSGWKDGASAPAINSSKERPFAPSEVKTVVLDKDITQATIILGHAGISRSNPDYYSVSVMNYILGGGGFASRLMKIVRDEMGLAYSIHSAFTGNKYPGYFEVEVQTKNESAGVVIEEILKQMRRIMSGPVTDLELDDAKAYLTGSFPRRLETSRKIADLLPAVRFYGLGDDYIEKYKDYINSVTKEDVLRAAAKYLNPDNYKLVVVGNKKHLNLEFKK